VGIEFAYLLVRPEALETVAPDLAAISALGGTGVSLVSWDGSLARTRVFPAGAGIVEDPATGSAALGFGVFLAASGLVEDGEHDYVVTQGVEMGRPSTLTCRVAVEGGTAVRTTVSGSAVPVARGEIRVPCGSGHATWGCCSSLCSPCPPAARSSRRWPSCRRWRSPSGATPLPVPCSCRGRS
jgi:trans-2,3-dihydro-3-hydroxyanthranilate isomerase